MRNQESVIFGEGYGRGILIGLAVVMVYGVLFMDWNTDETPFKGVRT